VQGILKLDTIAFGQLTSGCMNIATLSSKQLRRAAAIKVQIGRLQNRLNYLLGGQLEGTPKTKRRRKMSAAGRARIAAAQKARWAKIKARKK